MTGYLTTISTRHLPTPSVADIPEHRCGNCYSAYGRSVIPCKNDPEVK